MVSGGWAALGMLQVGDLIKEIGGEPVDDIDGLRELMERHGGNVTAASQQAGMLRSALQRLLRKCGLKSADFRRRRQTTTTGDVTRPRS